MKKLIITIIILLVLIIAAAVAYIMSAIKKLEYDYKITSYKVKGIDIAGGKAVLTFSLDIIINSTLFFNVPIRYLFYEIYYKGNLLGKSTDTKGFMINKEPGITNVSQVVDVYIDKKNIQIAQNYVSKTPTEFTAKVIVNVFGININLKDLKFTY